MKVEIVSEKPCPRELNLGDLIKWKDSFYLVIRHSDSYVAKSTNGDGGLFGHYPSLEKLNEEFNSRSGIQEAIIYKSSEYNLQLVRRDVK